MADKPEREEEEEEEGAEGWWQCGDKWASSVVAAIYNMEHLGTIFIFYFLFSGQNPPFFFFAKTMPPPCASHTHNNNNKISWLGTYSIHLFPYPTFTVLDTGTLPFWEYLCILGYK